MLNKRGTVLLEEEGNDERPEIERGTLRDLLLAELPDGTVRWNRRPTSSTSSTPISA